MGGDTTGLGAGGPDATGGTTPEFPNLGDGGTAAAGVVGFAVCATVPGVLRLTAATGGLPGDGVVSDPFGPPMGNLTCSGGAGLGWSGLSATGFLGLLGAGETTGG